MRIGDVFPPRSGFVQQWDELEQWDELGFEKADAFSNRLSQMIGLSLRSSLIGARVRNKWSAKRSLSTRFEKHASRLLTRATFQADAPPGIAVLTTSSSAILPLTLGLCGGENHEKNMGL
jgi:hypothetical protein